MRSCRSRGFTVIEIVISLSIVSALLVIAFAGLRVGVGAWWKGEQRAEEHQHARSLIQLLQRALEGGHPYEIAATVTEPAHLLFEGGPERVAFVTGTPPVPGTAPISFTAVTISREPGPPSGLVLRQRVLPNHEPFARMTDVLVDGRITALRFRYLRPDGRTWEDHWDAVEEKVLPRAVEITLTMHWGNRRAEQIPLAVPLQVSKP